MNSTNTFLDFKHAELKCYTDFYATVLDNVFTQDECQELLNKATRSSSWAPAGMSAETPSSVHSDFRNSERILYIDKATADGIYERLRPLVETHIGDLSPGTEWEGISGKSGRKQGPSWKLAGVNPRLSFLRYGPGHYFKPHCDGLNELPQEDGSVQKSFVTLQIYLNGSGDIASGTEGGSDAPLIGGSTRFWSKDKNHFLDVLPKMGRALVFQQRMLIHSGEEVTNGVKYTMRTDFMYQAI